MAAWFASLTVQEPLMGQWVETLSSI